MDEGAVNARLMKEPLSVVDAQDRRRVAGGTSSLE
jgi:hypothetical protein